MPTRVQFADEIEPLGQFIEETPPSEILDQTLAKLRAGVPPKTMLTASALAVTRSSDLPPGHHGGPLHPLVGLHAVHHLVARLEGEHTSELQSRSDLVCRLLLEKKKKKNQHNTLS